MKNYVLLLLTIFIAFNKIKSQTFYLYGTLNDKDKIILNSIFNNLITENKNKPLKNVTINSINNNLNKVTLNYKKINIEDVNSIVNDIYYLLKPDKPQNNLFKSNLVKYNKNEVLVFERNSIPNKISLKTRKYKYSNSSIALNFFKTPISFDYINMYSKYEISAPHKIVKLKYNNDLVKIDKVICKTDKRNWKEITDFYTDEDILMFQIDRNNFKEFDLNTILISEEGDSSEIKTLNSIKFSKTDQLELAEISDITLELPSIMRCKKLSESGGTNHYLIKISAGKDFDIEQINLNLTATDKDNITVNYTLPIRELEPENMSILNLNNKTNYCLYISPTKFFGPFGDCLCDDFDENTNLVLWIDNNSEFTNYFKPNNISNKKLPVHCQGFKRTIEELKILPACDCK
jgi:hypothetical protein